MRKYCLTLKCKYRPCYPPFLFFLSSPLSLSISLSLPILSHFVWLVLGAVFVAVYLSLTHFILFFLFFFSFLIFKSKRKNKYSRICLQTRRHILLPLLFATTTTTTTILSIQIISNCTFFVFPFEFGVLESEVTKKTNIDASLCSYRYVYIHFRKTHNTNNL